MKNIRIYLIGFLLLLATGSCKNYLDIKPYGQTVPKTAEEFAALLHTHLNNVDYGNDSYILGGCYSILELECLSDNLDASLTSYPGGNSLPLYPLSMVKGSTYYRYAYETIRDCNLVIENMEQKDSELGKEVLATAYTMRAVCYYNLVRRYCSPYMPSSASQSLGLPIVKEFDIEAKTVRSDLKKTVMLVVDDLNEAIRLNLKKDIYRFTVDVAKAYLAKTYFWMQEWDKVIPLAEELLQAYPLVEGEDYKTMIQDKYGRKGNVYIRSYIYPGTGDISYSNAKSMITERPVAKTFIELFTEGKGDIRYELSFNQKRQNVKNMCARIRGAEMCLMLSESYAHANDQENALKYLNSLRSRRITPYMAYTPGNLPEVNGDNLIKTDAQGKALTKLMSAILCERQKELFMEGDRWFELKRNGCPEFWVTKDGQKYVIKKYMYTFPIPVQEMILVPGMVQNEGYVMK